MSSDAPGTGARGYHGRHEPAERATGDQLPVVLLLVGAALAVVGQFILDGPADTTLAWHWIQHGTLFGGGVAVGAAVALLYVAGRARG